MSFSKVAIVLFVLLLLALAACGKEDASANVQKHTEIIIEYESNWFFNKYDVRISINDTFVGNQWNGQKVQYTIDFKEGVNTLTISEVGNDKNSITESFEVSEGFAYYFLIKAEKGNILIKSTDVLPVDSITTNEEREALETEKKINQRNAAIRNAFIGWAVFVVIVIVFLRWLKHYLTKKKNTANILAAVSGSKECSFIGLASSCNMSQGELIRILEKAIGKANALPPYKANSNDERYRIFKNAQLDFNRNIVVLDENAGRAVPTYPEYMNSQYTGYSGYQAEPPKEWECPYCHIKNSGHTNKCSGCGALKS